jgi:hypothetical protein
MKKPLSPELADLLASIGVPPYASVTKRTLATAVAGMDHNARRVLVFKLRKAPVISAIAALEIAGVVA